MHIRIKRGSCVLFFGYLNLLLSASVVFAEAIETKNTSQLLSLSLLVQQVLISNPKMSQMQTAFKSAQTRSAQVSAYTDPMLSYAFAPQSLFSDQTDYGQIITASQRVPWPGKLKLKQEVAQWQATASRENINTTRLGLIAASKIHYTDWQFVYAAIMINEQNINLFQEFRNIAEIKCSSGQASKQDVLRADVEITLLSRKDEELNRQKLVTLAQLDTLLNQKMGSKLQLPSQDFILADKIDINHLNETVLKRHPELKELKANVSVFEKKRALAKRNFYPDLQFIATYNSLRMNTDNRFTVGVGVNIPLQGKRHSAVDEASLNLKTLRWKKQALIAEIQNLLQQHYIRLTEAQHIISLYEARLLPPADENLQAARTDYESGQGDFMNMITAEQNLIKHQLQLEKTRADYQISYAMLEKLSGGYDILQQAEIKSNGKWE